MLRKSWVSPYNFINDVKLGARIPSKVSIYDVTLRDGEQTPGVVFRKKEKVKIAKALDSLGVKRIEAGMPVISTEDKKAIEEITHLGLDAEIWGFCRCIRSDVDACLDVDVDAVICEVASSDLKLKAYNFDQAKVETLAVETLNYAKEHGLRTAFFPVDMTRTGIDFLKTITTAAIHEGHADELVAVDTLGVALPEAMYYLVGKFKEWFSVPIHIHCHNDFGLGTACTLAAIKAGAEWAHVTVNGLGEKAGNTDLSELVLSLNLLYGVDTGIEYKKLVKVSRLVQKFSRSKMPPHKPVVGDNVFRRESGVTVSQLIKYPPAVESFPPEMVGAEREIVLGKKSGKHSVEWKLEKLGLAASPEQIDIILNKVKTLSARKKRLVSDKEFREIVDHAHAGIF